MEVSGQLHAPAVLPPREEPLMPRKSNVIRTCGNCVYKLVINSIIIKNSSV
jgi:hypothetical protein